MRRSTGRHPQAARLRQGHFFGTDGNGRGVLADHAGHTDVADRGGVATLVSVSIGVWGMAGYFGGRSMR
jgi:ABC-type dipeptide/oligopeptide/nickel transport system permease subunit